MRHNVVITVIMFGRIGPGAWLAGWLGLPDAAKITINCTFGLAVLLLTLRMAACLLPKKCAKA